MKRTFMFIYCFFLISFFSALCAQITLKTEYFAPSSYRYSTSDTDEKVSNSKGSAIVHQGGINLPISIKMNDNNRPSIWGISAGGAYASLNNKNFTEDLVIDEIMNLGLNIYHVKPLNEKWSIMASIGGGVYAPSTRFSKIRFKNVLGNGGVIFIRHLKPNLEIGGGIAVNNSFGYPMVFPALYLNWFTQGSTSIRISMMDGLEITAKYEANKLLDLNLVAGMNGQMALLEKEGKDMIFTHQYIITGFQPELKLGKNISMPITAGIHAMRTAEFSKRSIKSMFQDQNYYFQVSPYASAGIKIGF